MLDYFRAAGGNCSSAGGRQLVAAELSHHQRERPLADEAQRFMAWTAHKRELYARKNAHVRYRGVIDDVSH